MFIDFVSSPIDILFSLTAKVIIAGMAHIVEQQHYISHVYYAIGSRARRYIPAPFAAQLILARVAHVIEKQHNIAHVYDPITIGTRRYIATASHAVLCSKIP